VACDQVRGTSAAEAGRRLAEDKWQIEVGPGRHIFQAKPAAAAIAAHRQADASLWTQAVSARTAAAVIEPPPVRVCAAQLRPAWRSSVQGFPYALEVFRHQGQSRIAVSEGRAVVVLDSRGEVLHRLPTEATAKVFHYWPQAGLLAAGCQDFKVIAFDPATAQRRWVFESQQINPIFQKSGATGWFDRSPPWNKGIFALNSGLFLDGKSQLLVGTASTVEALDEHGKLVKSMMPGCGVVCDMALLHRGSEVILMPALPHGRAMIYQLSNRDPDKPTFYSVGAFAPRRNAATFVSEYKNGYVRLAAEDLDADGRQELVGLFNGSLNGLHVWNDQGEVVGDAAFGDGAPAPLPTHDPVVEQRNMRDMAIADLDGDAKKEIAVITSRGFLIVLDWQGRRLWGRRLPSEPTALVALGARAGAAGRIAVGCHGGELLALDAQGDFVAHARIEGIPVRIGTLDEARIVVATSKGQLLACQVR
jgi:outer membrane protein assembly factor BamB